MDLSCFPKKIAVEFILISRSSSLSAIAYIVSNIVTHIIVAKKNIHTINDGYKFVTAVYAIRVDIANVIPRNNWGAIKKRFVRGYVIINIIAKIAKIIVFIFKKNRSEIFKNDKNINTSKTSFLLIKFAAYGLSFVLLTFISKFLSKKSFTTHPMLLVVITPTKKI